MASSNQYMDEIRDLLKKMEERMLALENPTNPPEQIIYDDVDLRNFLKVSKRTTAAWREQGIITFSKLGGKLYYRLSDILLMIKQHEIPAVTSNLKIAL
jgi:hypothetical protein